jgi:hypothetical protein
LRLGVIIGLSRARRKHNDLCLFDLSVTDIFPVNHFDPVQIGKHMLKVSGE